MYSMFTHVTVNEHFMSNNILEQFYPYMEIMNVKLLTNSIHFSDVVRVHTVIDTYYFVSIWL